MTDYYEHEHEVPPARYLIKIMDGATALCDKHAMAFEHTMRAAGHEPEIYEIPPDEEPIACQACHLAGLKAPRILLPH